MPLKTSLIALIKSEDWWACWLGISLFTISLLGIINTVPRPTIWLTNPFKAVSIDALLSYLVLTVLLAILFSMGIRFMGGKPFSYLPAFALFSMLGLVAQVISKQYFVGTYGLEYVLWALIIGLVISNTVGLPVFLKPAIRTELYMKTGLVLLGAEIMFSRILNLGIQGLILAWGVTPIILFLMYRYGTSVLRLDKTLTILIAAAASVCGVSAAIAVAAATKAKKELLTLTISISFLSTVILLVGLPAIIKTTGINYIVGGAWIGGTVDSTGAVVAAGELLDQQAMEVATVIKLVQNLLIGVIAFVVALLWVTNVERRSNDKPSLVEVWYRFPKFIIAFTSLSLISSFVMTPVMGEATSANILRLTGGIRTFLFTVAFLSIGLESNFKSLKKQILGGKPVLLYIAGQSLNIILTLIFAWLLFGLS
jgi:uncharacterized integral membrane protein (TIGR00698 family)